MNTPYTFAEVARAINHHFGDTAFEFAVRGRSTWPVDVAVPLYVLSIYWIYVMGRLGRRSALVETNLRRNHVVRNTGSARRWESAKKRRLIPVAAEFLFYLFLDPQNCDAIVGDLEGRYRTLARRFGARKANVWYWTMAFRSVGPIAWAWFRKLVLKPVLYFLAWMMAHGLVKEGSLVEPLEEFLRRIRG